MIEINMGASANSSDDGIELYHMKNNKKKVGETRSMNLSKINASSPNCCLTSSISGSFPAFS